MKRKTLRLLCLLVFTLCGTGLITAQQQVHLEATMTTRPQPLLECLNADSFKLVEGKRVKTIPVNVEIKIPAKNSENGLSASNLYALNLYLKSTAAAGIPPGDITGFKQTTLEITTGANDSIINIDKGNFNSSSGCWEMSLKLEFAFVDDSLNLHNKQIDFFLDGSGPGSNLMTNITSVIVEKNGEVISNPLFSVTPKWAQPPLGNFNLTKDTTICGNGLAPAGGAGGYILQILPTVDARGTYKWTATGDVNSITFVGVNNTATHDSLAGTGFKGQALPPFTALNNTGANQTVTFTCKGYLADDNCNVDIITKTVTVTVLPVPVIAVPTYPHLADSLDICSDDFKKANEKFEYLLSPIALDVTNSKADTLFYQYSVNGGTPVDSVINIYGKTQYKFSFGKDIATYGDNVTVTYHIESSDNTGCQPVKATGAIYDFEYSILQPITIDPYTFWYENENGDTIHLKNNAQIEVCPGTRLMGIDAPAANLPDYALIGVPENNITIIGAGDYKQNVGQRSVTFFEPPAPPYGWFAGNHIDGSSPQPIFRVLLSSVKDSPGNCNGAMLTDTVYVKVKPLPRISDVQDTVLCPYDNYMGDTCGNNPQQVKKDYVFTVKTFFADSVAWDLRFDNSNTDKSVYPINVTFPIVFHPNLAVETIQGITFKHVKSSVTGIVETTITVPENLIQGYWNGNSRSYVMTPYGNCAGNKIQGHHNTFRVSTYPTGETPMLLDLLNKDIRVKNGDMISDIWLTPFHDITPNSPFTIYWERVLCSDDVATRPLFNTPELYSEGRDGPGTNIIPRFYATNNTKTTKVAVYKFYTQNENGCRYYLNGELRIIVTPYIIDDNNLFLDEIADITTCNDPNGLKSDIVFNTRYMFEYPNYTYNSDSLSQISYKWRLVEGKNVIQDAIVKATNDAETITDDIYTNASKDLADAKHYADSLRNVVAQYDTINELIRLINYNARQANNLTMVQDTLFRRIVELVDRAQALIGNNRIDLSQVPYIPGLPLNVPSIIYPQNINNPLDLVTNSVHWLLDGTTVTALDVPAIPGNANPTMQEFLTYYKNEILTPLNDLLNLYIATEENVTVYRTQGNLLAGNLKTLVDSFKVTSPTRGGIDTVLTQFANADIIMHEANDYLKEQRDYISAWIDSTIVDFSAWNDAKVVMQNKFDTLVWHVAQEVVANAMLSTAVNAYILLEKAPIIGINTLWANNPYPAANAGAYDYFDDLYATGAIKTALDELLARYNAGDALYNSTNSLANDFIVRRDTAAIQGMIDLVKDALAALPQYQSDIRAEQKAEIDKFANEATTMLNLLEARQDVIDALDALDAFAFGPSLTATNDLLTAVKAQRDLIQLALTSALQNLNDAIALSDGALDIALAINAIDNARNIVNAAKDAIDAELPTFGGLVADVQNDIDDVINDLLASASSSASGPSMATQASSLYATIGTTYATIDPALIGPLFAMQADYNDFLDFVASPSVADFADFQTAVKAMQSAIDGALGSGNAYNNSTYVGTSAIYNSLQTLSVNVNQFVDDMDDASATIDSINALLAWVDVAYAAYTSQFVEDGLDDINDRVDAFVLEANAVTAANNALATEVNKLKVPVINLGTIAGLAGIQNPYHIDLLDNTYPVPTAYCGTLNIHLVLGVDLDLDIDVPTSAILTAVEALLNDGIDTYPELLSAAIAAEIPTLAETTIQNVISSVTSQLQQQITNQVNAQMPNTFVCNSQKGVVIALLNSTVLPNAVASFVPQISSIVETAVQDAIKPIIKSAMNTALTTLIPGNAPDGVSYAEKAWDFPGYKEAIGRTDLALADWQAELATVSDKETKLQATLNRILDYAMALNPSALRIYTDPQYISYIKDADNSAVLDSLKNALTAAEAAEEAAQKAYEAANSFYRYSLNWDISNGDSILVGGIITCPLYQDSVPFALAGIPFTTTGTGLFAVEALFGNSRSPEMYFRVTVNESDSITYLTPRKDTVNVGDVTSPEIAGAAWYSWVVTSPNGGSISLANGSASYIPSFTSLTEGDVEIRITPYSAEGCPGKEETISINIRVKPEISLIRDRLVCSGTPSLCYDMDQLGKGLDYGTQHFELKYVAGLYINEIMMWGDEFCFYNIKNETNEPLYSFWTVTKVDGITGARSESVPLRIKIDVAPALNDIDNITASNGQFIPAFTFGGNKSTGGYSWKLTSGNDVDWLASKGEGNVFPAFTAINTTNAPINLTYEVVAYSAADSSVYNKDGDGERVTSCDPVRKSFTITIYPDAKVSPIADVTLCSGVEFTPIAVTSADSLVLEFVNGVNFGLTLTTDNKIVAPAALTTTTGVEVGTYRVTSYNKVTGVKGASVTFTVTVNPLAVVNAIANIEVYNGDIVPATQFAGNFAGGIYRWVANKSISNLPTAGEGYSFPWFKAENLGTAIDTAIVTVTPYLANGLCAGTDTTFKVIVHPTPVTPEIADIIICKDSSVTVSGLANVAGVSYAVNYVSGYNFGVSLTLTDGTLAGGTFANESRNSLTAIYSVVASENNHAGKVTYFAVTVVPNAAINAITPDTLKLMSGDVLPVITFTGNVSGGKYAWTLDAASAAIQNLPTAGEGNFPGASDRTLYNTSDNVQIAKYTVTASAENSCVTARDSFWVAIYPIPAVTDVVKDSVICSGNTYTLDLTTKPNVRYDVAYESGDNTLPLPVKGTAVTYNNATNAPITTVFSVTPYNTVLNRAGAKVTFSVTVLPVAHIDPITPNNLKLISGDALPVVTFSGNVQGGKYTWEKILGDNIVNLPTAGEGNFPGASNRQVFNTTSAIQTADYRVTASNGKAGCEEDTETFKVTVYPTPAIIDAIEDDVLCSGEEYTLALTNLSAIAVDYRVAYVSGNRTLPLPVANTPVQYVNTTSAPITAVFSVTPYNTELNRAGTPKLVSITVQPALTLDNIFVNNAVYENGQYVAAIQIGSTTISGAHFVWERDGVNIGLAQTKGVDAIPAFTAKNETSAPIFATFTVYLKNGECVSADTTFTITVYPRLVARQELLAYAAPNAKQVVCHDEAFTDVVLTAEDYFNGNVTSQARFIYRLITGEDVIGPYQGSTVIGYTIPGTDVTPWKLSLQPGRTVGTGRYEIIPVWNNYEGKAIVLEFTRLPKPTIAGLQDVTLCSGESLNLNFQSTNGSANSFKWTTAGGTLAGFPATGQSTSGLVTGALVNEGTAPVVITVTVTAYNGVCDGDDETFTVTVNPKPVVNPVANQFIASGGSVSVNFSGTATKYEWTADANAPIIGSATSGTGDISFTTLPVNEPTAVTYTVTPYYGACTGTAVKFSIVVANKPIIANIDDVRTNEGDHVGGIVPGGLPAGSGYGVEWTGGESIGLPNGEGKSIPGFTATLPAGADKFSPYVVTVTVKPYVIVNGQKYYGDEITYTYTVYPKVAVAPDFAANHDNYKNEICSGDGTDAVTFVVAIASGNEVSYQWYKNGVALTGEGSHGIVGASHQVEYTIDNATGDDAGIYYVLFNGSIKSVAYELIVKKAIIYQQWNNVLVIADASMNGGYAFRNIVWYKDGVAQAQNSVIYKESTLSFGSHYHFTAIDQNDKPYTSCDFVPVQLTENAIAAYPNPARIGENVTVTNAPKTSTIQLTSQQGAVLSTTAGEGEETIVKAPNTPGVYIINVVDNGTVKSVSIIVK